jgi:tetratricopeptide (TPR) repeat protein
LREKQALVIYADKPATLESTPADPPAKSFSAFDIKAKLNDSGMLEGHVETTIGGGDSEVLLRTAFRRTPFPQWKDVIQQISYASGFAGDASEVSASSPDALDVPLHFSYTYLRKDYPDWANRKIGPPLPLFGLPALGDDEDKLSAPIWLGAPGEHRFSSEVELPKGYSPELPKNIDSVEDFAEYHASNSSKEGVLITKRQLVIKLREVPIGEYAAYKKFSKAVSDDHDVSISLSSGKEVTGLRPYQDEIWQLPYSTNAEAARAYDDAREEYNRNDRAAAIASLNHGVTIDPKFTRAWLWLGDIYTLTGQHDLALQAYRKAVEIDPAQSVSYKPLGMLLTATSKFSEAIPVWQKLMSIAPQDPFGPTNLGFTYLQLKSYKEAAAAFDAAAKLQPDWAFLQMDLGICYLHTGPDDKALDSFKKTTALDPSSNMLNSVAYALADANKGLTEALEYAEKAVHDEEEVSNKIDLNTLKVGDLASAPALAAYWDTLGWVYFRLKNYDKAENYLESSWHLSLGGVQADHLGQVYEAQHDEKNAIRMYRMAIAIGSPKLQPALDLPKIRGRLGHLGGSPSASDNVYDMYKFKLPPLISGQGGRNSSCYFLPRQNHPDSRLRTYDLSVDQRS